jgi:hypothetical protein
VKPVEKDKLLEVIEKSVKQHVIMKDQFAT